MVIRNLILANQLNRESPISTISTSLNSHPVSTPPSLNSTQSQLHPVSTPPSLNSTQSQLHPVSTPPSLNSTQSQLHPVSTPPSLNSTQSQLHPVSTPPHVCQVGSLNSAPCLSSGTASKVSTPANKPFYHNGEDIKLLSTLQEQE